MSCIIFLVCLLVVESGVRAMFAYRVGTSIFLYGTPFERKQQIENKYAQDAELRTVQQHENVLEGYSKYFPNQVRYDVDSETQERFVVTINRDGFRGKDFATEKAPGVTRVITLGASSTFGYYSRDDDTYPAQLERLLNSQASEAKYEVINLGIPHLQAANIYALFLTEGLALQPDIVTFYEGNNDSTRVSGPLAWRTADHSAGRKLMNFLSKYLLSIAFINSMMGDAVEAADFSVAEIESMADTVAAEFVAEIQKIADVCAANDIPFFVASQQKRSTYIDREQLRGITYAEEMAAVKAAIEAKEPVTARMIAFVAHEKLMEQLKVWANSRQINYVDALAALDQERDSLVTHVHLNRRGNEIVATEMAKAILAEQASR